MLDKYLKIPTSMTTKIMRDPIFTFTCSGMQALQAVYSQVYRGLNLHYIIYMSNGSEKLNFIAPQLQQIQVAELFLDSGLLLDKLELEDLTHRTSLSRPRLHSLLPRRTCLPVRTEKVVFNRPGALQDVVTVAWRDGNRVVPKISDLH